MKQRYLFAGLLVALLFGCEAGKPPEPANGQQGGPNAGEGSPTPKVQVDLAHGKELAVGCIECHGEDGAKTARDTPYIGGQSADYLAASMGGYRDGSRKHEAMRVAVAMLNKQDLADLAAYYAGQSAAWKGSGVGVKAEGPKISRPDPKSVAAGRELARPCAGCHGKDGISERSEYPSLAGLPEAYLRDATRAYLKGSRKDRYMAMFKALTEREIGNLAAYYSSLKPKRLPLPVNGNATAGKARSGGCAGCHGADGNSLSPTMPSLTGQSSEYLAKAIADYRDGRRRSTMMKGAVARLSNRDIQDLAAYYASQQAVKTGVRAARPGQDFLGEGAYLAASCDGCHGKNGNSSMVGVPSLTGLSAHYLVKATREYRDDVRKHVVMQGMVSTLGDLDIEKVSFHYAVQKPEPVRKSFQGDAAQGEKLAGQCDACHGKQGVSTDPNAPSIAGQDPAYLASALAEYASGVRKAGAMESPAAALKKQDMADLAAYYALQTPAQTKPRLPEPVEVIAARCDRCHGEKGMGGEGKSPRLAGQVEAYLERVLLEYQNESRKNAPMHGMSDLLSLTEIHAIAGYYSRQ